MKSEVLVFSIAQSSTSWISVRFNVPSIFDISMFGVLCNYELNNLSHSSRTIGLIGPYETKVVNRTFINIKGIMPNKI